MKCVTVRVPQKDILQHVTLVDLPGNGDRNKSRDKMWKGVIYSWTLQVIDCLMCIVELTMIYSNMYVSMMYFQIVGNCSTVWIVAEINRAASEKESWDILKDVSSLIGNGGECRHIHFICTKTDLFKASEHM